MQQKSSNEVLTLPFTWLQTSFGWNNLLISKLIWLNTRVEIFFSFIVEELGCSLLGARFCSSNHIVLFSSEILRRKGITLSGVRCNNKQLVIPIGVSCSPLPTYGYTVVASGSYPMKLFRQPCPFIILVTTLMDPGAYLSIKWFFSSRCHGFFSGLACTKGCLTKPWIKLITQLLLLDPTLNMLRATVVNCDSWFFIQLCCLKSPHRWSPCLVEPPQLFAI